MDKKIIALLEQVRPDIDFQKEERLLSDGIFDSFDFIQILAKIVEVFNIEIDPADITVEDFDSAEKIAAFVRSKDQR